MTEIDTYSFEFGEKEGRKQALEEVEKLIDDLFYIKEQKYPIVSVDKIIELKQKLEKMK